MGIFIHHTSEQSYLVVVKPIHEKVLKVDKEWEKCQGKRNEQKQDENR
jgi:hypothetical protein